MVCTSTGWLSCCLLSHFRGVEEGDSKYVAEPPPPDRVEQSGAEYYTYVYVFCRVGYAKYTSRKFVPFSPNANPCDELYQHHHSLVTVSWFKFEPLHA